MEQPLFSIAEEIPEQRYARLLDASLKELLHDEPEYADIVLAQLNGTEETCRKKDRKTKPRLFVSVKARSANVCAIYVMKKTQTLRMVYKPRFDSYFSDYSIEHKMVDSVEESRIVFNSIEEIQKLSEIFIKIAFELLVEESFGCCNLFNQCSDARKCINPKRIMALGCTYRKNLEKGLIFYGAHPTAGANYKGE